MQFSLLSKYVFSTNIDGNYPYYLVQKLISVIYNLNNNNVEKPRL